MAAKTGLKQQCPHCDALVPIKDDSLVGKKIKCPKCGDSFLVEDLEERPTRGSKAAKGPANGKAAGKTKPGARRQRDEDDDGQPQFKKKSEGNSKLILGLGLGGVALVLLGVAAYFLFFNDNSPKKSDSTPPAARSTTTPPPPGGGVTPQTVTPSLTTTPTPVAGNPISNMLPPDTQEVISIAMAEVLKTPLGNQALNTPTFSRALGFPVDSIEQMLVASKYTEPHWMFVILRTKTAISLEAVQHAMRLKPAPETPPQGQDYFMTPFSWVDLVSSFVPPELKNNLPPATPVALRLHDSTTLVLADLVPMQAFLAVKGQPPVQTPATAAAPAATQETPGGGIPGGIPAGRSGLPRPGAGAPNPQATPAVAASSFYRTINPRLKAMMDLMENNKPSMISMAVDVEANPQLKTLAENPQVGAGLKALGLTLSFKTIGLSVRGDKTIAWSGLEFPTDQDAASFTQFIEQQLPQLETLAQMARIKIQRGATSGIQIPGLGGTGAGRPNLPGGGGVPPGAGTRSPGGGGKGLPPGAGQLPPGAGQSTPGSPGNPGGQPPKPLEDLVTLVIDFKQNGTTVVATVDIQVKDQNLINQMVEQTQPVLARIQGEVEMASVRPHPYVLGQAAKAYATKHQQFPLGAVARPPSARRANRPWPPDQRVSGLAELLPYLGYEDLHKKIRPQESWRDSANLPVASTLIPQFLSPDLPRNYWFVRYPGINLDLAATSYVGIAGVGRDAAEYKPGDAAAAKNMGIFGYNRATPLAEIDDPANTILLIQTPPTPKSPWMAGGGSTVRGVPETKSVEPFLTQRADGKRGAYMVMADGSVRWVTEQISDEVFKQLAVVKGQKSADLDEVAPKVPKPANLPELKTVPTLPAAPPPSTVATPPTAPAKPEVKPPDARAPNSPRTAADKKKAANDLKELALAYLTFLDSNQGKPPANLEELSRFFSKDGKVLQAMKEGKYVFLYGVGLQAMTAGTSNTILAYEKDVPTGGGQVVMADGSVKDMTAQEFQAAPKAK
jgi:predicted Zn finger-like uncharacterized protein